MQVLKKRTRNARWRWRRNTRRWTIRNRRSRRGSAPRRDRAERSRDLSRRARFGARSGARRRGRRSRCDGRRYRGRRRSGGVG